MNEEDSETLNIIDESVRDSKDYLTYIISMGLGDYSKNDMDDAIKLSHDLRNSLRNIALNSNEKGV